MTVASTAGDMPQLVLTNAAGDRLVFHGMPTADTRFGGPGERVFMEVAAETQPCSHPLIADKQCLQVREIVFDDNGLRVGEPGEWQNFYDDIEGFSHQPGTRNVLRVNRYNIANPPADASAQQQASPDQQAPVEPGPREWPGVRVRTVVLGALFVLAALITAGPVWLDLDLEGSTVVVIALQGVVMVVVVQSAQAHQGPAP